MPISADLQAQLMSFAPLIIVFAIFYFLILRPQAKRAREHQLLITSLKKGDAVLTTGGIYGKVTKVIDEASVEVEIAKDVKIKLSRASVAALDEQ